MRQGTPILFAALGALVAGASPAVGEQVITSLSNHRVGVTSNFIGDTLVLFGGIERQPGDPARRAGYDLVVTVSGPAQTLVTFRKGRALGIWVNAESRVFVNAPSYFAMLSTKPLAEVMNADTQRRLGLGLDNLIFKGATADIPHDDPFRSAFLKLKSDRGLYRDVSNGVTMLSPILFSAPLPLPAEVPVGTYKIDLKLFADGALIRNETSAFEVYKAGFEQTLTAAARDHGILYGLATSMMALATGWFASVVFRRD